MNFVNDFVIKIGTVNGTGSASANTLLSKAIFRMGVPITIKNLFPSNIQGLPTWFEIRASHQGYVARREKVDILVAMNPQTYAKDVAQLRAGGYLIYDSSFVLPPSLIRDGILALGVPLAKLCNENFKAVRERILMKNIAYVGVLAALMQLDLEVIAALLAETYGTKPKLLTSNHTAIKLGYDYAKAHFDCPLPTRVEPLNKTKDHIIIDGNTAAALGCLYAGATVAAWYPITPSTSLMDAFISFSNRYRTDKATGKKKVAVIQAEDEIAAIGIVTGAGFAGARSFTCTSGPGISLMNEFIGNAYFTEIPAVIFNVQRTGPSTGMPTRTQQSDLLLCAYASHGDTKHIMLFPANPNECFEMAVNAFDYAERFQTPVFVMMDLDVGMNEWMAKKITWDDSYKPDRGVIATAEILEKGKTFYRYLDDDNDGICARSLPGTHPKGAYFNRGSGHNKFGGYTEDSAEYSEVMQRLKFKLDRAADLLLTPLIHKQVNAKAAILSFGTCDGAIVEALDQLSAQKMSLDYLRVRAFPFHSQIKKFIAAYDRVYVVEQNRDAQMRGMLAAELGVDYHKLIPITHFGGMPISCDAIVRGIQGQGNSVKEMSL